MVMMCEFCVVDTWCGLNRYAGTSPMFAGVLLSDLLAYGYALNLLSVSIESMHTHHDLKRYIVSLASYQLPISSLNLYHNLLSIHMHSLTSSVVFSSAFGVSYS